MQHTIYRMTWLITTESYELHFYLLKAICTCELAYIFFVFFQQVNFLFFFKASLLYVALGIGGIAWFYSNWLLLCVLLSLSKQQFASLNWPQSGANARVLYYFVLHILLERVAINPHAPPVATARAQNNIV